MSLAAATAVCLGLNATRKNEALSMSNNSHHGWADEERQRETKRRRKKQNLCSEVLNNNKPSGQAEEPDYNLCWIKLLFHYQHTAHPPLPFNLVKSHRLEEAPVITFCFSAAWPLPLQFNRQLHMRGKKKHQRVQIRRWQMASSFMIPALQDWKFHLYDYEMSCWSMAFGNVSFCTQS